MYGSATSTTPPTTRSTAAARSRCSRPACAPAQMPAIPSCTVDGAFGIARTTGTSAAICRSITAVGIAAATESTVCRGASSWPSSASSASMSWGLTAITTTSAPRTASALAVVASTPYRSRSSVARSSRRVVTTTSVQPELCSPARSDSPILPAPRIAMRIGQGYDARVMPRQQVHAREPGPLAVRLEQLVRLLGLDPSPAERRHQLGEPEVAREAALEPSEPLEADDADRPRAETALALEPPRDDIRRQGFKRLEVERAADADERRAAPRAEAEVAELRRREPGQVTVRRRGMETVARRCRGADDAALVLAREPAEDQLARDRAQERLRDSRRPQRAQPAQTARRLAEQRVAREAAQELRVVVVEPEREAAVLAARVAVGADEDRAVDALPRLHTLEPAVDRDRGTIGAVGDDARRVAPEPPREPERVRPTRSEVGGDHRTIFTSPPEGALAARSRR